MPRVSRILHVNTKCRICLNDEGVMNNIFSPELSWKIKELAESTAIDINDGKNLPTKICHVCLYKLDMWCDFKKQFIFSNKILLQHLKSIDTIDYTDSVIKRRHSDVQDDFNSNNDEAENNKKFKSDIASDSTQIIHTGKSVDDDDTCDLPSAPIDETIRIELETTSGGGAGGCDGGDDESNAKLSLITKARSYSGRRTLEQRMASTQRWEARKKALSAATGENDSDTDSMGSDNVQLSVIQKSRSKNHYNEKEVERLRRLSKSMNNFDTIDDENNDTIKKHDNSNEIINTNEEPFKSHTIQSELVIGDATFIITSKLLLSESQYVNQSLSNTSSTSVVNDMISASNTTDINTQQQNTDIIDAVELCRINRSSDKNFIERCLNIEVEGADLLALQRIQIELDNYLMTGMKNKLSNNLTSASEIINVDSNKQSQPDSFHTLEQQLKAIVEKAIKKNLETTKMRRVPISKITTSNKRGNKIFSAAFIKAAMKSQIFQPKVLLNRVDPNVDESYKPDINSGTSFNDNYSDIPCTNKLTIKNLTMDYGENDEITNNIVNVINICNDDDNDDGDEIKKNYLNEKQPILDGGHYSCSICNELFATKSEIDQHLNSHKYSKNAKTPINIISKRKMMRCKRCHEIVESRYVKTHICEWKKSLYRCTSCNASFKNEHLLARHVKIHEEIVTEELEVMITESNVKEIKEGTMMDEVKIERIENLSQITESIGIDNDTKKVLQTNNITTYTCFVCDKNFTDEELLKDHLQQHCDDVSDDDTSKKNIKEQLYQCAICGETLNSETTLGYHVEKHLFDDNNIDDKKLIDVHRDDISMKLDEKFNLHACVQCNEQFDNEVNLALHVQGHEEESAIAEWEKHGLIKVTQICTNHTCTLCDDTFESEEALAHHIDIHNESTHVCVLCDKPFLTLVELQAHVNTH